jgi:hypothetical protein
LLLLTIKNSGNRRNTNEKRNRKEKKKNVISWTIWYTRSCSCLKSIISHIKNLIKFIKKKLYNFHLLLKELNICKLLKKQHQMSLKKLFWFFIFIFFYEFLCCVEDAIWYLLGWKQRAEEIFQWKIKSWEFYTCCLNWSKSYTHFFFFSSYSLLVFFSFFDQHSTIMKREKKLWE